MEPVIPAKTEKIMYNEFEIAKWSSDDGFCCFLANDIGEILSNKNIRHSCKNFTNMELISDELRCKYNITTARKYKNNTRVHNKMTLLTEQGLKRLLCSSRSIEAPALAKFLGIDIYSNKFVSEESDFVAAIIKSFPGETISLQYAVPNTNYRIDAYLPAHSIAIECDEHHHGYNVADDQNRQREISKILKCHWVRFKPGRDDIFTTIGNIYSLIASK